MNLFLVSVSISKRFPVSVSKYNSKCNPVSVSKYTSNTAINKRPLRLALVRLGRYLKQETSPKSLLKSNFNFNYQSLGFGSVILDSWGLFLVY